MNIINNRPGLLCFIISLLFVSGFPGPDVGEEAWAGPKGRASVITIKVKENQSIRDIAREYLSDPDLWPDVLRANNLKSPHEVQPGITLRIPVGPISRANKKLGDSKTLIRKATKAGAKIFAPKIIAKAITLRNNALEKRKSGEWADCAKLADSSSDEAKKALKISMGKQDVLAEAVVDNHQGDVQSRKPSDNMWKKVSRHDILLEGDKIRTLSQSFADVLFRDDSRLHLKENSQALIQKMRSNLLEDTEEANVSLIEGDVFALLASGKKDKRFKLDIPGVDTKINSQRFWVARDGKNTRFANYEGEIEVSSGGGKVLLKENQGSIVRHNQKPSAPMRLLPAPELLDPPDGDERLDVNTTILAWKKVQGSEYYQLEIAADASFSSVIWDETVHDTTAVFPSHLGLGLFNWRISAVSPDKMPGRPSKARSLRIMDDDKPPFLVVQHPEQGAILSESSVEISGNTEEIATLTIQGHPVKVGPGGEYRFMHKLVKGENIIVVKAADQAGKITEMKRTVTFYPESEIKLSFDPSLLQVRPNHFLVRDRGLALAGKTDPQGFITVTSLKGSFSATVTADKQGQFQINLQIAGEKDEFTIEVTTRTGKIRKGGFFVEIDSKPPDILFKEELPSVTGKKKMLISGNVEGGTSLDMNGEPVQLQDGQFSQEIELNPGMNHLNYSARDQVGNIAIIKKEIFSDSDAPKLVSHKISLKKAREQAKVTVVAKDATGLVKVAPFTVQIGKLSLRGVMKLSGSKGKYVGSLRIPKGMKGTVKLTKVTLSDYLGNRKEYNLGI